MRDLLRVKIVKRRKELFHDERGLFFRQIFLLDDVVEELTAFAKFKHQEADIVPLPNLVKFDDVWVILMGRGSEILKDLVLTSACRILTSFTKVWKSFSFFF